MTSANLLMSTAKLIIAAGYKMKEQARQEMAEEDLGGGIFDQDVKEMRTAASKCFERVLSRKSTTPTSSSSWTSHSLSTMRHQPH
jgi:hypothetical protein